MANTILLKRSSTPGSTPSAGSLTPGEIAINSNDGKLFTKKESGTVIEVNPRQRKSISIESPTSSEKIVIFYTTEARTISKIMAVLPGGSSTPSVTFSIRYGSDVSAAGTEVVTSGITVTSATTGSSTTSFTNATIPAGNFMWITTSAKSGTVPALHVTVEF